ncbi:MAG: transcriptional repressor, partial [Cyclobacteriaceae bacterium]
CTECQQVKEFCDPRIQNIQNTVGEVLNFSIIHHSLILYGNCTDEQCEHKPGVK